MGIFGKFKKMNAMNSDPVQQTLAQLLLITQRLALPVQRVAHGDNQPT